ncbi:hypothetical protein, partial [Muribaculum intestinale]|uniref:hypothetical protein n=1 Tax=Muribaculum intestinale TaxID=1796646 RepID=UPI00193E5E94
HWKCLKSRTINSALNEDAKNVCGALNICTKSLRIVKSHAPALRKNISPRTSTTFLKASNGRR